VLSVGVREKVIIAGLLAGPGDLFTRHQGGHAEYPALARVLDASGPDIAPAFILGEQGGPLCAGHVGKLFRDWCKQAGLPDECVLHGLRKAICRRLVQLGMTSHQIMAITGHKSLIEVQRYCEQFSREKAADQAMAALAGGYGAG
jgi:integrase/recombinase XerD